MIQPPLGEGREPVVLMVVIAEQVLTPSRMAKGEQQVLLAERHEVWAGRSVIQREGVGMEKPTLHGPVDEIRGRHEPVSPTSPK